MIVIFLLILLFVMAVDGWLLRQRGPLIAQNSFRVSFKELLILGLVMLLSLLERQEILENFCYLTLISLVPWYIIRRVRLVRLLEKGLSYPLGHLRLVIASDAVGVIIYWFYSMFLISIFLKVSCEDIFHFSSELAELIISSIFSLCLAIIFIHKASEKFSKEGFWVRMGFNKEGIPFWKMVLFPALLAFLFALLSVGAVLSRPDQPSTPLGEALQATESTPVLILFLITAVLVAPFLEEVIFRGYFFHVVKVLKGERFSLYAISFLFAFLHAAQYWGDWLAIGMVLLLSYLLTFLRVWAKTTIASALAHYVYNGSVALIPTVMIMTAN